MIGNAYPTYEHLAYLQSLIGFTIFHQVLPLTLYSCENEFNPKGGIAASLLE